MRSLLLVPAGDEAKLATALESGADALCIDLRDPRGADAARARRNAGDLLRAGQAMARRPRLFVRVGDLDAAAIDDDLDAIMPLAPDGVAPALCRNGEALQHLGAKLAVKEAECGLEDGSTGIFAIAGETAASIFEMGSLAGSSRRLVALAWSASSLRADLGAGVSRDRAGRLAAPYALARGLTLLAARAAGALAIDAPHSPTDDGGLRLRCEEARRDGFDGKLASDRGEVEIINAVFAPRRFDPKSS